MTVQRPSVRRFRLAEHIRGAPLDPPQWAPEPRLREKSRLPGGRGTTVAVLDSGISRHPWLRGSYREPLGLADSDLWDLSGPALPRHIGHGTFVAGIVLQYAPSARIVSRRVIDLDGEADDTTLATTIDGLRRIDPDVLNLSLTPAARPEPGTVDEGTARTLEAVRKLQDECGTVVVVAAGNSRERFPQEHLAPEDELTVVVGALDLSGRPAWFSNREFVTIWAPGVDVLSSFVYWGGPLAKTETSDSHDDHDHDHAAASQAGPGSGGGSDHDHNDHGSRDERPHPMNRSVLPVAPFTGWARWNGTSFATPAVAGAIAAEISRLGHIHDRKERRKAGLIRVLDAARDIDVDGEKTKALAAAPVALEGTRDDGDHGVWQ